MAQLKVTVNARGAKSGASDFTAAVAAMGGAARQFEQQMAKVASATAAEFGRIAKNTREAASAMTNLASSAKGAGASLRGASDAAGLLKQAMVAIGAANIASGVVSTITTYEQLRAALVTTMGSAEAAGAKFKELQAFAEATPFSVEEAVRGFTHMRSVGLEPTIEKMRALGDMAAMRPDRSFLDLILAIADGASGADKRLKDFGVDLKKAGDEMKIFYGGEAFATVKNNAKEIEEALVRLASAKFGGAMERQAATLGGQISQLKDKAANLADTMGSAGLLGELKLVTSAMLDVAKGSTSTAHEIGFALAKSVRTAADAVRFLINHSNELTAVLGALAAYKVAAWATSVATAFGTATVAAGGFTAAMRAATIANPFAWVAVGVAGLIEIVRYWDDITAAIDSWEPPEWAKGNVKKEDIGTIQGGHYVPYQGYAGGALDEAPKLIALTADQQAFMNGLLKDAIGYVRDYKNAWDEAAIAQANASHQKTFDDAANAMFAGYEKLKNGGNDPEAPKKGKGKTSADHFREMQEQLNAQQAYFEAYQAGGERALKVEEKFRTAMASAKFPPSYADSVHQWADAMVDAETATDRLKEGIASMGKAAQAEVERQQKQIDGKIDFFAALQQEATEKERLVEAIQRGIPAYEHELRLIAAENTLRAGNIELIGTQGKLLDDYLAKIANYDKIIKEAQEGAKTTSKAEDKAAKQKSPIEQMTEDYATAEAAAQKFNEVALSGINQFSSTLATALVDGKADWVGFYKSMQKEVVELVIKMLIATAVKAALGGATGGASLGLGATYGSFTDFMTGGFKFHEGGKVGAGGSPVAVNPAWFSNAPRFHSGTIPALRGDELPAILQKGEVVLSRDQVAQAGKGGKTINQTFILPDVRDSRTLGRSLDQHASRLRRLMKDTDND